MYRAALQIPLNGGKLEFPKIQDLLDGKMSVDRDLFVDDFIDYMKNEGFDNIFIIKK